MHVPFQDKGTNADAVQTTVPHMGEGGIGGDYPPPETQIY